MSPVDGEETRKSHSTSRFKGDHDVRFPRVHSDEAQRDGAAPGLQGHLHRLVHLRGGHGRRVFGYPAGAEGTRSPQWALRVRKASRPPRC